MKIYRRTTDGVINELHAVEAFDVNCVVSGTVLTELVYIVHVYIQHSATTLAEWPIRR